MFVHLGQNIKIEIPRDRQPKRIPSSIKMGIRPQDVHFDNNSELKTEILLVEPMGRDDLIVCKIGDVEIHFLADPANKLKRGDRIGIKFDTEKLQFFDNETGKSLLWS